MDLEFQVNSAAETRAWGSCLHSVLRPGDLVMLSGQLGAGKTTLAQGIGAGLGVRGPISSPTFIVARVHPPLTGKYPLIHVDAYRITDLDDLETLDLDSSVDQAITLVEWGEDKVEDLAESRLLIQVERKGGGQAPVQNDGQVDLSEMDDGKRKLHLQAFGPRWQGTDWKTVFSNWRQTHFEQ